MQGWHDMDRDKFIQLNVEQAAQDPNPKETHTRNYLRDYVAWVEGGALPHKYFERGDGLCDNLDNWMFYHISDDPDMWGDCHEVLEGWFEAEGLNLAYPFHDGQEPPFRRELLAKEVHLNAARTEFARKYGNV